MRQYEASKIRKCIVMCYKVKNGFFKIRDSDYLITFGFIQKILYTSAFYNN